MEKTLAYECTIYLKMNDNETYDDAAARMERILKGVGVDFTYCSGQVIDDNGQTLEQYD